MQNSNQQRSPLTKSLMTNAFWISFKLIKIILPPLAGMYAWIYLIPVLFPMLKGPIPNREPKTFQQVVMEAKKREAERLRLDKELQERTNYPTPFSANLKYPQE